MMTTIDRAARDRRDFEIGFELLPVCEQVLDRLADLMLDAGDILDSEDLRSFWWWARPRLLLPNAAGSPLAMRRRPRLRTSEATAVRLRATESAPAAANSLARKR